MSPKDGFAPARYAIGRPTEIGGDVTKGFSGSRVTFQANAFRIGDSPACACGFPNSSTI